MLAATMLFLELLLSRSEAGTIHASVLERAMSFDRPVHAMKVDVPPVLAPGHHEKAEAADGKAVLHMHAGISLKGSAFEIERRGIEIVAAMTSKNLRRHR